MEAMEREDSRVEYAQHRARLKESGLTFRERISLRIQLVSKAYPIRFGGLPTMDIDQERPCGL